ncbi:hypothetical protein [Kitasatospora sp. NPDC050543]|uniref:terpene synthase family protein n=1 Tax=Kitasatospora sp. NPDC050543 TaxID=3364054 RepID=UPI0037A72766
MFDMVEPVGDFEVPPVVWHSPLFAEIRDCLADVIACTNDLTSAGKEAQTGEGGNSMLLIAERHEGLTRAQAFERLRGVVHARFERVLVLEEQVGDWDALLTEDGRRDVRRYLQGLHDIVAGDNRWERVSGRYR